MGIHEVNKLMPQQIRRYFPSGLRARVMVTFGIVTFIVTLVVIFISGQVFTKQLQGVIRLLADQLTERTNTGLNTDLNRRLSQIDQLAFHVREADSANNSQALLELFSKLHPDMNWVSLTNADGQIVASTNRQLLGINSANQQWFRDAKQLAHEPSDSSIERAVMSAQQLENAQMVVRFSAPMQDRIGKFDGAVVAEMSAEQIYALMTQIIGADEKIYAGILVDSANQVVVGPSKLIGQHLQLETSDNTNSSASIMGQAESGERINLTLASENPTQPIDKMKWRLLIQQNSDRLFEPVLQAWQELILSGIGLGLLIAGIYWFLADLAIRPITQLTQVAARMKHGDTRLATTEHSEFSEVAMLSSSLNTLVNGLAAKENELRVLNNSLSHRVQERTLELVLITDSLQNEVTQRRELIQRHEQLMAELLTMASLDSLTHTFNRRTLFQLAEEEFLRARRLNMSLSIIMLDLDRFKQVNDTFGHAAGDEALIKVAENFRHVVRESDMIGRYGGEEFIFVLPDTDEQEAMLVAERLRKAVWEAGKNTSIAEQWELTASLGVAALNMHTEDLNALIKSADDAHYSAKHAGRNRIAVSNA